MNMLKNLSWHAHGAFRVIAELVRYAIAFIRALLQPKAVLAARLVAVESQLAVCKHRIQQNKVPRPRFNPSFRLLWVILSRFLGNWQQYVHLMQPATETLKSSAVSAFWADV